MQQPTRPGVEPEQLHRDLGAWLEPSVTAQTVATLHKRGAVELRGTLIALPGFVAKAQANPELVLAVLAALTSHGLEAPTIEVLAEGTDAPVREVQAALQAAAASGQAIRLSEDLYIAAAVAQSAAQRVVAAFVDTAAFTTGELKEVLGLTRKHLIPIAEYLDASRVTVRDPSGNRRVRDRAREAWLERQKGQER
jgi:selenocysteine-specific elongation factor